MKAGSLAKSSSCENRCPPRYDVYGLGNALVDIEYRVEESFLERHGIAKGHMTLVDETRLDLLTADLQALDHERFSGGSAANTLMAVQGFGGNCFYSCRVAEDEVGDHFLHDLTGAGIRTNHNATASAGRSGLSLILITEDAERSMNTFLGVSSQLDADAIDRRALAAARTLYIEGYLTSSPPSLLAAATARRLADEQGVATAVSLSDPSMVQSFRNELERLLGNGVDWLFCNEEEALTWAKTDRLDLAIAELKDIGRVCFLTLGRRGSLSVVKGKPTKAPGFPADAVDTTGAGDIYAGACLYGLSIGMAEADAARFGNFAAAALVQRYGARLRNANQYRRLLQEFPRT